MENKKSYYQNIVDISKSELLEGLLGYGLFSDKMPPFLTSKPFYDFCLNPKNNNKSMVLFSMKI
jgi:hypothetical protein